MGQGAKSLTRDCERGLSPRLRASAPPRRSLLAVFALSLILLTGCDKDKKQEGDDLLIIPKGDPPTRLRDIANGTTKAGKFDEPPEEIDKAKLIAQIKQSTERAMKAQEQEKKNKKKNKTPDLYIPLKGNRVLSFDSGKEKDKKKKKDEESTGLDPIGLSGQTDEYSDGSRPVQLRSGSELQREEHKRSFFDKIFGRNKEPQTISRRIEPGSKVALDGSEIKEPKKKDHPAIVTVKRDDAGTVASRVAAELAHKRLKNTAATIEAAEEEKAQKPDPDAKGEFVEIEPPKAAIVPDDNLPFVEAPPKVLTPADAAAATEADIKAAAEHQYKTGLEARDIIARHEAYQYAAFQRRRDVIPYLIDEIVQNKYLASYAAQYLGAIGELPFDAEDALLIGLAGRDAQLRQACAESLGRVRCRRAQQPLLDALKTEKSYVCRTAYVQALGYLGDRDVITALKVVLELKTEVEFVKMQAALSLARLGDPSGRAHLIRTLDSAMPAMQVLGLNGMAQLNDPDLAGYLNSALESAYDEVWNTAIVLFPKVGADIALPMLRNRLAAPNDMMRRRAALAIGMLGSDEALPFIERSVRTGPLAERVLGCDVLGRLGRTDKVPLLIERLQDTHQNVRQTAAIALTNLNAVEAIEPLIEASRGWPKNPSPFLKPAMPDASERLFLLCCVRSLRGETETLTISSLPGKDQSWPEVDRALSDQHAEFLKLYVPLEVLLADSKPAGIVIRNPNGREILFRQGEMVAAGYKISEITAASRDKQNSYLPPSVTLIRGKEEIILTVGEAPQVRKRTKKEE